MTVRRVPVRSPRRLLRASSDVAVAGRQRRRDLRAGQTGPGLQVDGGLGT